MTETTYPTERVEVLEAELEALEERLREALASAKRAQASAKRAQRRLQEIDTEKDELSAAVFSGDADAVQRYEACEEDEREASRSLRVAQVAGEQLRRAVAETSSALSEARKEVRRERYKVLSAEHERLAHERDEVAKRLITLLEEESTLNHKMVQALRHYDPDRANAMASNPNTTRRWLRDTFARWLR